MAKDHGPAVKDDKAYEDLRGKGYSKSKAAAIANGKANPSMHPSRKGGKAPPYEDWTKDDLYARARELDIAGRSSMSKAQLIDALRG